MTTVEKREDGFYYILTLPDFKAEHGPYVGPNTATLAAEYLVLILKETEYFG